MKENVDAEAVEMNAEEEEEVVVAQAAEGRDKKNENK